MQSSPKAKLVDRIASELHTACARGAFVANASFPSVSELAASFGVSYDTVRKAVRRLRDDGLIEIHQGSRPRRRVAISLPTFTPRVSSLDRLTQELRVKIGEVFFRTRDALPKLESLAIVHHVSKTTVARAYDALIAEGLAHREGKHVIVGRQVITITQRSRPFIMIVCKDKRQWNGLCTSSRTHEFARAFTAETRRYNVQPVPVETSAFDPDSPDTRAGSSEVNRIARAKGRRYIGALVIEYGDARISVGDIINKLLSLGKPVVWLDRNGEGLAGPVRSRMFTRCTISEEGAVVAALQHLREHGHTEIGYRYSPGQPWQENRLQILETEAAKFDPPFTIAQSPIHKPEDWLAAETSGILELLSRMAASPMTQPVRSSFEFFANSKQRYLDALHGEAPRWDSPFEGFIAFSAARVYRDFAPTDEELFFAHEIWRYMALYPFVINNVTAVVGPNDSLTESYVFKLLRDSHITVPDEISVVSFDNRRWYTSDDLSTVDFGFQYLGYQAFHAILRDIEVRRSRGGVITAPAVLIDKDTVTAPRSRPLQCYHTASCRRGLKP